MDIIEKIGDTITEVPAVWDRAGRECPEIAEALQLMLN